MISEVLMKSEVGPGWSKGSLLQDAPAETHCHGWDLQNSMAHLSPLHLSSAQLSSAQPTSAHLSPVQSSSARPLTSLQMEESNLALVSPPYFMPVISTHCLKCTLSTSENHRLYLHMHAHSF